MHLGYGGLSTAPVIGYTSASFNPRPTSRLGAKFDLLWLAHCRPCFNPRSTSRLGAAGTLSLVWTKGVVVSILIEPLGWARVAVTIALLCFNSHSTSSAGCNSVRSSFNPHKTYRLGAGGGSYNPGVFQSSPNLFGWMQMAVAIALLCFNSHPTSRPGADGGAVSSSLFQSSPNLSVGCKQGVNLHVIIGKNRDAPDRKPGEYDLLR